MLAMSSCVSLVIGFSSMRWPTAPAQVPQPGAMTVAVMPPGDSVGIPVCSRMTASSASWNRASSATGTRSDGIAG